MSRLTLYIDGDARGGLDFLRKNTNANSDGEAIRNALRLHHALIQAHLAGAEILMRKRGTTALEHADLFTAEPPKPKLTVVT
jgi:hypothetical protein